MSFRAVRFALRSYRFSLWAIFGSVLYRLFSLWAFLKVAKLDMALEVILPTPLHHQDCCFLYDRLTRETAPGSVSAKSGIPAVLWTENVKVPYREPCIFKPRQTPLGVGVGVGGAAWRGDLQWSCVSLRACMFPCAHDVSLWINYLKKYWGEAFLWPRDEVIRFWEKLPCSKGGCGVQIFGLMIRNRRILFGRQ